MREVVVVSAVRTPIGRAGRGALKDTRPDDLCALVIREAVWRVRGLAPGDVEDVVLGCAFPEAEQGMNVARLAALLAGLPAEAAGATVNRFCASGLQAVVYAAHAIAAGAADVVVAGGVESMSRVPMRGFTYRPNPRLQEEVPGALMPMGLTAENVAARYGITRAEQDDFALGSHRKAVAAQQAGRLDAHVMPVQVRIQEPEEQAVLLTRDEGPRPDTSPVALAALKPAFQEGGTVTAGNASGISDGAAALVLMSGERARSLGLRPLAAIRQTAVVGVDPAVMGIGPVPAVQKLLGRAGIGLDAVGLVELNEAFAAQALACIRLLELDEARVNVNGGAIAQGHPLGATGARLLVDLVHEMGRRGVRFGIETMCVGGGQGLAVLVESEG